VKNSPPSRVLIGPFELDQKAGELRQSDRMIRLQKKPCQVLMILVEYGGELVSREEIQKRLWPNDTVVDFEHAINTAIRKLRTAFEDSADSPKYIETLARRGYRLMVPVKWLGVAESHSSAADEPGLEPHEQLQPSPQVEGEEVSRTAPAPSEPSTLIGRKLSHYRVLEVIGGGGMGVVYRAEDLKLGRAVALKVLPEELGGDPKALERFEREARAASALDHPNICSIYEFGEHQGQPFLALQLLEGQTLRDHLAAARKTCDGKQALPLDQLLDIAIQVARGLEAAHEKGIVHRDIKPANIFITTKGVAKILDFGVAKLTSMGDDAAEDRTLHSAAGRSTVPGSAGDDDSDTAAVDTPVAIERTLTRTGIALGTAGYMSPEQVRGEKLDARTDLFSFGLVLYEMGGGQRAFCGETAEVVRDAILHQTQVPIHDLNSKLPHDLGRIINKALKKDREERYQSAAEMRDDLNGLHLGGDREIPIRRRWKLIGISGGVVVAMILIFLRMVNSTRSASRLSPTGIAILPFQNVGSGKDLDFLRLALPDEIATALSYAPSLSIRPSTMTEKYVGPDLDLQKAGREMRVANIVTGHYLKEGDELHVTVEAVNVENNRVIWQDELTASRLDMIAIRDQIVAKLRQGLLPTLGVSKQRETRTRPSNEDAYNLYLRSIAVPHDPASNREAIAMLESSLGIDPDYAPAWESLGLRYYYDATYSNGGEEMFRRSNIAYERALALDPNLIVAAGLLITNQVERREPRKAYEEAEALVKRHPESGPAHFVMAHVYQYAGMLEQSAKECDTALELDPGNYFYRSCAWPFMELGKTARAADFIRLDAGSEWSTFVIPSLLLREGKVAEAREALKHMPTPPQLHRDLLETCLQGSASDLDRIAQVAETNARSDVDPELLYRQGAILAFCDRKKAAVYMIKSAIGYGYCGYSNLVSDPLLANLRHTSEFHDLLLAAGQCQERYLAK
jgi:serine/threonine protein kinase/DNA-binding winged helix-turn-helix (wHTH) protein